MMLKPQHNLMIALALLSAFCSLIRVHKIKVVQNNTYSTRQSRTITQHYSATPNVNVPVEVAAQSLPIPSEEKRRRCQIVYLLGVEGTMHHGVEPIIEALARHQMDHQTNTPFNVQIKSDDLRYGLFAYPEGHFGYNDTDPPPINDPSLVNMVLSAICPDDNRHHITIESTSFPSGGKFHSMSRIRRQSAWHQMTPESIANSHSALNHPTNLYEFFGAYSPYAQIKFVVLHRGFLETVASHKNFDGDALTHANVIHGYLILLSRFLDSHRYYNNVQDEKLWSIFNTDAISAKYYHDNNELEKARQETINNLQKFLGWTTEVNWRDCFDSWVDSSSEYVSVLGNKNVKLLTKQMNDLEAIWPPPQDV